MKTLDSPKSGKRGNIVAYHSRYGQIERQYVVPQDPCTATQITRRSAFGRARFLWGTLTDAQRLAWNNAAVGSRTEPRLNQSGRLTGYLLFVGINCDLALIGEPMRLDPPPTPQFPENPVDGLTITNSAGTVALKLRISGNPVRHILVFATRPRTQGTTWADHFAFIGLLPEPNQGASDITGLYIAKYGVPRAGARVFVRTVQQIDGWQGLPKPTSDVVPAP